jgi:hypothetical protein
VPDAQAPGVEQPLAARSPELRSTLRAIEIVRAHMRTSARRVAAASTAAQPRHACAASEPALEGPWDETDIQADALDCTLQTLSSVCLRSLTAFLH